MIIAAFLLDEAQMPDLADWLLTARPDHAKAVAAGVAAIALRQGLAAVWDALAAADAMAIDVATELYETPGELLWGPEPGWLLTSGGRGSAEETIE